jgi:MFS superfamily sulfate permease-like transporter
LLLALVTFLITHHLLKISIYIPAPLIAIGCGIGLSYALHDPELTTIGGKYGVIPTDFFVITPPRLPAWDWAVLRDVGYLVVAIVFVSGVESLLCSRMADRLADNRGTPFSANKEFWGQGLVQVVVPLLNGFPHTGALARTATNIKLGAMTPLAGIFKCFLKLLLAYFLASLLALVPMACIGGILMWVAFNMVKPAEVKQVLAHNRFHIGLMALTAVTVIVTDFLTGVLTGMIAYALLFKFLDTPRPKPHEPPAQPAEIVGGAASEVDLRRPVNVG